MHANVDTKLAGEVEVDETYIGGKARNMHKSPSRHLRMRGATGGRTRSVVLGLLAASPAKGKSR